MCRLLVYLQAPNVAGRVLDRLDAAATQEEQIQYAIELRLLDQGWSLAARRRYFQWFVDAASTRGGLSFGPYLRAIREEAIQTLGDRDRRELASLIDVSIAAREPTFDIGQREHVRDWNVVDLLEAVSEHAEEASAERGRKIFAAATCYRCHRYRGEGGSVGPDLTAVGRRLNLHDLVAATIEPNRAISDQYRQTVFVTDQQVVVGRIVNVEAKQLIVNTNMLDPSATIPLVRAAIEEQFAADVSAMPSGLLNTFSAAEVADLLAYLRQGE